MGQGGTFYLFSRLPFMIDWNQSQNIHYFHGYSNISFFMSALLSRQIHLLWTAALFLGFCLPGLSAQQLHLNEIMASNNATIADEDGDFPDWIEIYNSGNDPIHLDGYGLSDDYDNPFRWVFPDTTIAPGEFMLIWASNKNRRVPGGELHTNYAISSAGEEVILTHPDGTRLDELPPTEIPTDISFGRQPDGTGEWFYFDEPTPGAPNTTEPMQDLLENPTLSHRPGFYTSGFDLELTHPQENVTIYYTLDGSAPTENSAVYSGPISIQDRTNEPNNLSTIRTNYLTNRYGFQEPAGLIPKGTVVRTLTVKPGYMPAYSKSSFFVYPEGNEFHKLPVISISTDSTNLFGYEEGLYVPGIHFKDGVHHTGNYYQRGIEWEREAGFEFFDESGELKFAQNVGLRIHGGYSRRFSQKSFRLYARSEYGENRFRYQIFPDREYDSYNRLLLRNSGNDQGMTMIRDAVAHLAVRHLNMDTQAYRPAVIYINGEYWGIKNFRERYDRHYLERVYGIDPDRIDLLTGHWDIKEGDNQQYASVLRFIDREGLVDDNNMEHVRTLIDLDNFLDYYAANVYYVNTDWPHNNIDFWRLQTEYDEQAPPGHDGRWRWLFYDIDFTFGLVRSYDFDMLHWVTRELGADNREWSNLILRNLLDNVSFTHDFINRMADHLNTTFLPERVTGIMDSLQTLIEPEMPQYINRWNHPTHMGQWNGFINTMRNFANARPGHLRENITNHFGLESQEEVTVDVNNQLMGTVQVNSLHIAPETEGVLNDPYPWSGIYFSEVPITLFTVPKAGYILSHWLVDNEPIQQKELELIPGTFQTVTAIFTEIELTSIDPFVLADGTYLFSEWNEDEPAGTYPENMIFVYMNELDPGLNAEVHGVTHGAYYHNSRTRINGLGEDGFAFINTSNLDGNPGYPGRRLGGAILALDSEGQGSITVQWSAGTVLPNSRIYNIRLQYRTDPGEPFRDVLDSWGNPVEYARNEMPGHSRQLASVLLPPDAEDQPNLELLFRYYYTGERTDEESGQRAKLNISSITVHSEPLLGSPTGPPQEFQLFQNYPNPFYPHTTIRYDLPQDQHVRLNLYTITGRHVATLQDSPAQAGRHSVQVDASGLASGVYIYQFVSDEYTDTGKMSVIK